MGHQDEFDDQKGAVAVDVVGAAADVVQQMDQRAMEEGEAEACCDDSVTLIPKRQALSTTAGSGQSDEAASPRENRTW